MAQATPSGSFGGGNPNNLSTPTSSSSPTPGPPTPASTTQNASPAPNQSLFGGPAMAPIANPVPIRSSFDFTTQNGGASGVARSADPEVVFDQRGDLRLEVKADIIGGVQYTKIFVVSSRAMSSACDAWYAMLNGPFRESQAAESSSATERVVPFPDDDAFSMAVLLNIAHLRFKEVPSSLTFSQLVELTRLTDKYGATHLLRPWAKAWISQHEQCIITLGHESWLWVAWELGQTSLFECLVSHLVKTVRVQDGKCYAEGEIFPLSSYCLLPPGIIESILKERQKTIAQILNLLYACLDKCITPSTSLNRRLCGPDCDMRVLGSLVLSLKKAGLRLEKMKVAELPFSVNELLDKLINMQICHSSSKGHYGLCQNARPFTELNESLSRIVETIPSALQDSHRRHLERQSAIIN
ncbi:uncharacterized protein J3D65DRAFT_693463 [Phyllosticta citribraziliensis]|uniref:Nuclear pore protein n=1 Tax=Phyllosticta citribraziliensis TaxID=989973 RepID=A0ABR1LX62_9PEZI